MSDDLDYNTLKAVKNIYLYQANSFEDCMEILDELLKEAMDDG